MTGRDKLAAVFRGDMVDAVPFALKGWRVPSCTLERELRNRGMAILDAVSVVREHQPNVRRTTTSEVVDNVQHTTTVVHTPKGDLTTVTSRQLGTPRTEGTSWTSEYLFKSEADYDAVEFMVRDTEVQPNYDAYYRALDYVGTDAAFKTSAPGAPIHWLMYYLMGIETFSMQLVEHEDRVMALLDALRERDRNIFEIVAASPAERVQIGGNYTPDVLGKLRLRQYVVPHWEEACAILHEGGKQVGSHLDANNKLWAREIGDSGLDWIEAFSPVPDTDMTVAEAREAWPGKVLFINFPSAVHLAAPDVIRDTAEQLIREAAPGDRFIIGITENVPDNRWQISFPIILETCNTFGKLPVSA